MNLADASSQIETGDLISVRTVHGPTGLLTRLVTRSPYTHSGVALWLAGRLFMAEINSGRNHLVALSSVREFDVSCRPPELAVNKVEQTIIDWLADPIEYSRLAFVVIGILNLFHIKKFVHWRNRIVCSGAAVKIWEKAGWPEHSYMVSPAEVAKEVRFKLAVEPG